MLSWYSSRSTDTLWHFQSSLSRRLRNRGSLLASRRDTYQRNRSVITVDAETGNSNSAASPCWRISGLAELVLSTRICSPSKRYQSSSTLIVEARAARNHRFSTAEPLNRNSRMSSFSVSDSTGFGVSCINSPPNSYRNVGRLSGDNRYPVKRKPKSFPVPSGHACDGDANFANGTPTWFRA